MRAALLLVGLAAALAVADWVAVGGGRRRAEMALKPAVMVALAGAALALPDLDLAVRLPLLAALLLSLAGDVCLMPPRERFAAGLACFLVAHLAYIAAFLRGGIVTSWLPLPAAGIALPAIPSLVRITRGARAAGRARLVAPIWVYGATISVMFATAVASGRPLAAAGAALFLTSDWTLAWTRFVRGFARSRLAVIVTYHEAQILLVLAWAMPSLVR